MLLSKFWAELSERIALATGRDLILAQLSELQRKVDLLEEFSHGTRATYVGKNRILIRCVVANANIAYLVEADDRILAPWFAVTGKYETLLTDFFVRNLASDSHCIDVGANFGYFTCLMARFCPKGKIIGIEPDKLVYELARDNVFINGFEGHARMWQAAVSDTASVLTLHRRNTRSANTSITKMPDHFIESLGEPASTPFDVESVTIDRILADLDGRVDFLKIDVEGAEPLVFMGAQETIARNPNMTIVMEWSPAQIQSAGFGIDTFLALLEQLKLRAADLVEGGVKPLTFEELARTDYRAGIVLTRRDVHR